MGINDIYDHTRGHILLMDPLPNVNRAYYMVLHVENHMEVNQAYLRGQENNAFLPRAKQGNYGRGRGGSSNQTRGRNNQTSNTNRGRGRGNDKNTRFYDYYNALGHVGETCFQLKGYPEWYQ